MTLEWRLDEKERALVLRMDEEDDAPQRRRPTDRELIEQARGGDREAFGELVRQYRAEALGMANRMIRDPHLAEDVVQDALVRAFLHLGKLLDAGKFAPWLRRIVRNQALLKLRRGGPYAKESPFSGLTAGGGSMRRTAGGEPGAGDGGESDWTNIDLILFRLQTAAASASQRAGDPAEQLMRVEMLSGLRELLHILSRRERAIFEAHFFGELPPAEIAKLLDTSAANVYNSLSRARAKVRRERIRVSIGWYVQKRAEQGLPRRRVLAPPP